MVGRSSNVQEVSLVLEFQIVSGLEIGHPGVFLYCRRARQRASSSREWLFQDVAMSFFIDFTIDSILPLLCG